MNNKYEVVKFVDNELELDVRTDKEKETVWLKPEDVALAQAFDYNEVVVSEDIFSSCRLLKMFLIEVWNTSVLQLKMISLEV